MLGTTLEEMSEADVLAFADECAEAIREAEADLLRVAYQWAVLHDPARLDPAESALPGREKARSWVASGTPQVCEFAAAELGARIGRTTYAAAQLMADALDLHHRHPQLWARVEAGEVRASYARHVFAKTRDLSQDEAAFVDAAVAESADGRIPWSRFEALVEAKVAQAAPEAAREREEQARKATFAKKLPRLRPSGWPRSWSAPTSRPSTRSTPPSAPSPTTLVEEIRRRPRTNAGSTPSCCWSHPAADPRDLGR